MYLPLTTRRRVIGEFSCFIVKSQLCVQINFVINQNFARTGCNPTAHEYALDWAISMYNLLWENIRLNCTSCA